MQLGSSPVLDVHEVRKAFGGVVAVDGVSLQLGRGEIRAVIGPNGAGKSTFFDLISGWLASDGGRIHWEGRDVTGWSVERLALQGIGRTFQRSNNFLKLTVLENVLIARLSHRRHARQFWRPISNYRAEQDEALAILAEVGLEEMAGRPVHELAYGDQKRLDIAIGLAVEPRLLIMDEPLAGLAPGERGAILDLIRELVRSHELTVLFSEHDVDSVLEIAERITVLHQGRVLAEGEPDAIVKSQAVRAAFLGEERSDAAVLREVSD